MKELLIILGPPVIILGGNAQSGEVVTTRLTVLPSPSRKLRAEYRWRSPRRSQLPTRVHPRRYESGRRGISSLSLCCRFRHRVQQARRPRAAAGLVN
jgi:hypothetical protein